MDHWSPSVASSSFQALNPSQATRGIIHSSPFPYTDTHGKIPVQPGILQTEGPDGMGLGEFGLKKNDFVGVGMQLGDGMGNYPTFRNLEFGIPVVGH